MREILSKLHDMGRGAKAFMVALLATAALVIPAGLAQGAKITKAIAAKIKRNTAELKHRIRANPQLLENAKPPSATFGVSRRIARQAARQGEAHASAAIGSKCSAKPGATFNRQPGTSSGAEDAINSYWSNTSSCSGKPVEVAVQTNMVDPHGTGNVDYDIGTNYAQATGLQQGPEGVWNMLNTSTWIASPPLVWKQGTGVCAGQGTPVLTCKYPRTFPILLP